MEQYHDISGLGDFLEKTEMTAFLIIHEGRLVEERYRGGHDRQSVQNTFSISKSLVLALVGLALRDGVLELDAPITRYLPERARASTVFGSTISGASAFAGAKGMRTT